MKFFSRKILGTVLVASFVFVLVRAPIAHAIDCTKNVCLINPLANTINPDTPVQSLVALFINTIFGISGSIALAMYVWGGTKFLISRGDPKMVEEGKKVLIWTSAGVLLLFTSYTIVNFIFTSLSNPSSLGAGGSTQGASNGLDTAKSCCINISGKSATTLQGSAQVSHPDCPDTNTNLILVDGACTVVQDVNNCANCLPNGTPTQSGSTCTTFTTIADCASKIP
ncbi:MAG: pilin [Candidatus Magasanikbacteria bacterium]|nr:pilin [Candidatus Magasanikbacteria bacterium]